MARLSLSETHDQLVVTDAYQHRQQIKLAGGKWDPFGKRWLLPLSRETVEKVCSLAPVFVDQEIKTALAEREYALAQSKLLHTVTDVDVDFRFKTRPFAHQRVGFAFLTRLPRAGLLWEMGLGKTKTTIDAMIWRAQQGQVRRVLVICPNSVKYTWAEEVKKHSDADCRILDGPIEDRQRQLADAHELFLVQNVESLDRLTDDLLLEARPDAVVLDEATRCKNPRALRTKALMRLQPMYRVVLTGTPVTQSPMDVWAPFTWLDPSLLGSYWQFQDRYCVKGGYGGKEIVAYKNLDELAEKLATISLRYRKEDVLDLPPKMYQDVWVDMSPVQRRLYDQMTDELYAVLADIPEEQIVLEANSVLTQLLRLEQIASGIVGTGRNATWLSGEKNAKQVALDDLLTSIIDEGKGKAIVWCRFVREIEALSERYRRYSPAIVFGDVKPAARQAAVDRFQNDPETKLFIGQISTAGLGITLTAARSAIYYSRDFSLENYLQSQDRCHRVGQTGSVTIYHIMARNSIDEYISKILVRKQRYADKVTGDITKREILEVLQRGR